MYSEPRVLHIEIGSGLGGIGTFLLNVYRYIDHSKLQFDFVTVRDRVLTEQQYTELGGRIFKIPYGNMLDYYRELVKLISENGYKIVHIHKNSAANIIPFLACRKAGVKVIVAHSHNTKPTAGRFSKIFHFINRPILNRLADKRFACSDLAALWLFGKGYVDKKNVAYVRNGIVTERFAYNGETRRKVRRELELQDGTFLIGNVGRMTTQKNQVFLVDILCELKKRYGDTKLLICGDGELRGKIWKRGESLGVADSLILPGRCSNIEEILQAMDAYVMPSIHEGLTVAAVEAQCAGLPVVLSDTMSKQTVIAGNCRMVSLKKTAAEWAEEILELRGMRYENAEKEVREAGFHVRETASFLQDYYLNNL